MLYMVRDTFLKNWKRIVICNPSREIYKKKTPRKNISNFIIPANPNKFEAEKKLARAIQLYRWHSVIPRGVSALLNLKNN